MRFLVPAVVAVVVLGSSVGYGYYRIQQGRTSPLSPETAMADTPTAAGATAPAQGSTSAGSSSAPDPVLKQPHRTSSENTSNAAAKGSSRIDDAEPEDDDHPVANHQSDTAEKTTWVDWTQPTGGPYPDLSKYHDIWVEVSIPKQRTYIHAGDKIIYTMIVSTGIDGNPATETPRGVFHIQPERGTWFYAPRFQEGAEYWVSFLNHGQYLFHSVPMDKNHHVIESVAKDLGHEDSHGCVHLSIPDAKWFYDNIPTGTKVVIH